MKNLINQRILISLTLITCFVMKLEAQLPVINTENGVISGYRSGDINIFKGIPFAAPPVGDLRWKAPQPVKNWTGVLNCPGSTHEEIIQNKSKLAISWKREDYSLK